MARKKGVVGAGPVFDLLAKLAYPLLAGDKRGFNPTKQLLAGDGPSLVLTSGGGDSVARGCEFEAEVAPAPATDSVGTSWKAGEAVYRIARGGTALGLDEIESDRLSASTA